MMAAVVAAMTLGELLGPAAGPHGTIAVSDLVLDSRQVRPGAAFVAVQGTAGHGLAHAHDALARGAAIVLFDPAGATGAAPRPSLALPGLKGRLGALAGDFFWRHRSRPELYGVTGTNGKTTVAYLVAQAQMRLGRDCAYVGTLGFGRPAALTAHALTTPDCLSLHRELAMVGAATAILEVSSHGLAQDRIAGLEFRVAAVTNLSRDHLDAHGSMTAYAQAKSRIVELPGLEAVVLNLDDSFAAGLRARVAGGVRVVGVSLGGASGADLQGAATLQGLDGLLIDLSHGSTRARLDSRLIGDFNAENLLVALGILLAAGHDLERAAAALGESRAAPGRLEVLGGGAAPHVVVDYAHTPAALARVLAVLRPLTAGELTCVFGCGGDRDKGKRAQMGSAANAADRVILTDDNPRSENPAAIVADIAQGIDAARPLTVEHDRRRAITAAIAAAGAGDVVLIAGKGHETTQTIGREVRPFDDRRIARAALGGPT